MRGRAALLGVQTRGLRCGRFSSATLEVCWLWVRLHADICTEHGVDGRARPGPECSAIKSWQSSSRKCPWPLPGGCDLLLPTTKWEQTRRAGAACLMLHMHPGGKPAAPHCHWGTAAQRAHSLPLPSPVHPQLPAAASLGCGAGQPHSELCLPEACLRSAALTASSSTMSVSPLPGGSETYVTRWVLAPAPPIIQCLTLPRVSSFITLSFGCHHLAADTLFYQATKIHPKAKCFGGE